jgi:cytochrome c-type biogenesis protein CcmH/NrfF
MLLEKLVVFFCDRQISASLRCRGCSDGSLVHSEAGSWLPTSLQIGRGQKVYDRQNMATY